MSFPCGRQRRVAFAGLAPLMAVAETLLFVSPNGDDASPGSVERPFATVARAQRAVRDLKARGELTSPLTVTLRGGTYRLDQPLVFTPEDSGTAECRITYRSHPGEKAVLSGGKRLHRFEFSK